MGIFREEELEILWSAILSGDPERIISTFGSLGEHEQASVLNRLKRMSTEPGWHQTQHSAARFALETILEEQKDG